MISELHAVTPAFACLIVVDETATIVETAPMLRRFCGQPLSNLTRWMSRAFPWYRLLPLQEEKPHADDES